MKFPALFNCYINPSDKLTVQPQLGDVVLFTEDREQGGVSIYLTPDEARRLREALKAAIKESEK